MNFRAMLHDFPQRISSLLARIEGEIKGNKRAVGLPDAQGCLPRWSPVRTH